MRKVLLLATLAWVAQLCAKAQQSGEPSAKFQFSAQRLTDSTAAFSARALLGGGLQVFGTKPRNADDPFVTSFTFAPGLAVKDSLASDGPSRTANLAAANGQVVLYADSVQFSATLRLNAAVQQVAGAVNWLGVVGTDQFPAGTDSFAISVAPIAAPAAESNAPPAASKSGWSLFLFCLLIGLAAVFTPCVFPLIPVTVSFFLKRSKSRPHGVRNAWIYALSIVLIYTVPTLLLTLAFGDKFLYQLSTHPVTNLVFFAIFLVFAISFFGAFELSLPSSWAGKADEKAGKGGVVGIFFMALTLVIVSFSCTGPIVGSLLGQTSGQGLSLGPVIGMLGFGVGLALPFGVFALFPSMLKTLPKSGGWLNTVKVFFGFVELALAMKFLSNADLAYHWGLLNRDVFLSIWIVIFALTGLYLLGKLKFSHDSDLPYLSVPRFFMAMAALIFAVYMVPGLWGAPLTPLSGILPPPSTQKFNLNELQYTLAQTSASTGNLPKPVKYANTFHVPFGLTAYFDLQEGLAAARQLNKPVMIDFTGWSCANCRKMENEVWSDRAVLKRLREDFVLVSLYVDDKTPLTEAERYTNVAGERITTIGAKNLDYEIDAFNLNAQPLYKFLNGKGDVLSSVQYGYDPSVSKFLAHLDAVQAAFEAKR
jgi:thiol:disulfide interchange protein